MSNLKRLQFKVMTVIKLTYRPPSAFLLALLENWRLDSIKVTIERSKRILSFPNVLTWRVPLATNSEDIETAISLPCIFMIMNCPSINSIHTQDTFINNTEFPRWKACNAIRIDLIIFHPTVKCFFKQLFRLHKTSVYHRHILLWPEN